MSFAYCVKEQKPCVRWADKYFRDCLCNTRDDLSFGFGLISLFFWGVAEIPQIVTNFRTKSSHGVSVLFLLTWVAGDVFNLMGCLLEPATLPTQLYTALLYTSTTIILVLQGVCYDHVCSRWECSQAQVKQEFEDARKPLNQKPVDPSIPIPCQTCKSPHQGFYYMSARSLAGSGTPPFKSYLRSNHSSNPSGMEFENDSTDDEVVPVWSNHSSKPMPIPRLAGCATFLASLISQSLHSLALAEVGIGYPTRRRLLNQEHQTKNSRYGQWLGWLMAAIYMGGRLPQIWLNMKRGSVEGLNPLMFIFAMLANVAYVFSILARTVKWASIKANMPWLLDAVVCVLLDLFIILQYFYYCHIHKKMLNHAAGFTGLGSK